jgi:hypothetical protein
MRKLMIYQQETIGGCFANSLFWSVGDNFWLSTYCSVITSVGAFTAGDCWKEGQSTIEGASQ